MVATNGKRGYQEPGRLVPIPDPTLLTTQQLDREIANLEARVAAELKGVNEHINAVKSIDQGHFERIQIQFSERKEQVSLALQNQKDLNEVRTQFTNETIDKMDKIYTKLFDQMQVLLNSTSENANEKINDLKARVEVISAGRGRVDVMQIFSVASSVAAIVTVFYVLLTRH